MKILPAKATGILFLSGFIRSTLAQATNSVSSPLVAPPLPDAGLSIFRVFGALLLVIGIFLGGVWLFKNWQRLTAQRGRAPKLDILETRSLGGRQAIFVVGYEQERFLVGSSPAGINLLSHLPQSTEEKSETSSSLPPATSFSQALTQVLKRK